MRDTRAHGVEIRPVCVNHSRLDCTLERADGRLLAVRLGMQMVKKLSNARAAEVVAARAVGGPGTLGGGGRVPGLGLERRAALWAI
ncbi:MAG TPA: hypothetical protein VKI44_20205 [Acetobacteraceae bacterium]|nr:hypothetical protein [Acetobacteraceae bacterium]